MHPMVPHGNTEPVDSLLLARAIQGDREAFGNLYERYLGEVQRYIFYRVTNRFDAEDLTETVFIKAWEALPRFESETVNLRAWLYRIAHNVVVDHYRIRKPADDLPDAQLQDVHPSPEQQTQTQDEHQQLAVAIQTLDENLQKVVICRFVNGLSHAETAEVMGIKEGHVRVLQLRALQKLRRLLEKE